MGSVRKIQYAAEMICLQVDILMSSNSDEVTVLPDSIKAYKDPFNSLFSTTT